MNVSSWDLSQLRAFLIAAGDDRLHALFLVMSMTGFELDEALALRWSDVDLDAGTVRRHQQLGRVDGQPARTPELTPAGGQLVDFDPGTTELLRWHACRQRLEQWQSNDWSDTGLVFTMPDGSAVSTKLASRHFAGLVAALGMPGIDLDELPRVRAQGVRSGSS